jgi:hypothetical protein
LATGGYIYVFIHIHSYRIVFMIHLEENAICCPLNELLRRLQRSDNSLCGIESFLETWRPGVLELTGLISAKAPWLRKLGTQIVLCKSTFYDEPNDKTPGFAGGYVLVEASLDPWERLDFMSSNYKRLQKLIFQIGMPSVPLQSSLFSRKENA